MRRATAHSGHFPSLSRAGPVWLIAGLLAHLLIPAFFAGHVHAEHAESLFTISVRAEPYGHTSPGSEDKLPEHCDLCRLLGTASGANAPVGASSVRVADVLSSCGSVDCPARLILASATRSPAAPRAPPIF